MNDLVICDTNVAIQLGIIFPNCLSQPKFECRIVLHSIVKQEIHSLRKDDNKQKRLGNVFDFLLKEVQTETKLQFPNKMEEPNYHRRIQKFESGLDPSLLSSGSSHQDRCFLILAKKNNAKLLTNDKTLFTLGTAYLPDHATWRTSQALEKIFTISPESKSKIQEGLKKLASHEEYLHPECAKLLSSLGFDYP